MSYAYLECHCSLFRRVSRKHVQGKLQKYRCSMKLELNVHLEWALSIPLCSILTSQAMSFAVLVSQQGKRKEWFKLKLNRVMKTDLELVSSVNLLL